MSGVTHRFFRISNLYPFSTSCNICYTTSLWRRVVTCDVTESSCSRSVSSSSDHIWKECAGPGLGYWRCGISYGWNLTSCGSRYRNLAPPFVSHQDAAGTLPGSRRAANRMEVTWLNCATGYNPALTSFTVSPIMSFDTIFGQHMQKCCAERYIKFRLKEKDTRVLGVTSPPSKIVLLPYQKCCAERYIKFRLKEKRHQGAGCYQSS